MKNINRFTPDLYTEAQWQWVEAKYREGYYISQLAEFLGIARETLRRIFQQRGLRPVSHRRKCLIDGLNRIPGVYSPIPMGAFYTVAKLPVDDSDKFCAWCLSEFEYEGQTVFMAPASGFYTTPGSGRNEVRIAYVLKKDDLNRALFVLQKALEAYPGRTE